MDDPQQVLRPLLNRDKIKLWLPPYTETDGSKGEHPQALIKQYSAELNLSEETIASAVEGLRKHSVEKLAAKTKFQESGIATLRLKFVGDVTAREAQSVLGGKDIEINLKASGYNLKESVSTISEISVVKLKLISCGQVIDDNKTLHEQNIKNNSHVMVICLSESEVEAKQKEEEFFSVQRMKEDAKLLSNKKQYEGDPEEEYFMQVADQTGKSINLPSGERETLTIAMTLHEKGKACLKRKEYGVSLLLLLEADMEFRKCCSDILNAVDNFAILCLDIVWNYLCLKNVNDLPDAEARLESCEACFHRSYGVNLERLTLVKGATGNEQALYMRLHLLQGILAYYQGQQEKSIRLLRLAERELTMLTVDEASLNQVMIMGFSEKESRLGLRACQGNIEASIQYILKRNKEKKMVHTEETRKRERHKLSRKLGKTANGQWVNPDHYNRIIMMGFSKGAAREALRQGNNNLAGAIEILEEHPELLSLPDPEREPVVLTEEQVMQVVLMGFDFSSAKEALTRNNGDIQCAIDILIEHGGKLPCTPPSPDTPSESTSAGPSQPEQKSVEEIQKEQNEKEAMDNIVPDIPEDEDSYLDFTMKEEADFLREYKLLLNIV